MMLLSLSTDKGEIWARTKDLQATRYRTQRIVSTSSMISFNAWLWRLHLQRRILKFALLIELPGNH